MTARLLNATSTKNEQMSNTSPLPRKLAKERLSTLASITRKLHRAIESWEVEDELQTLWEMGDHGDLDAYTLYGLALLMEDKGWYDLEEGKLVLENAAESGSAMAQYYLGRFYLEGRSDLPVDPINGRYWIQQAAVQGYRQALDYMDERWR